MSYLVVMNTSLKQTIGLWTRAQPVVSAYVTSVVRDFAARDDIVQETAMAVIEHIDRYDPQRPFLGWVLGIARNQIQIHLRKHYSDRHVFDEAVLSNVESAFLEHPDPAQTGRFDLLRDCVSQLDGRARQICEMRYQLDLKPGAIASNLSMKPNSVAKALQRIREELKACLERKLAIENSELEPTL
jgi:RNA polymerase sigma-70 factor (ECF subfamily)